MKSSREVSKTSRKGPTYGELGFEHHAVIRVYDDVGNVIETHEHAGDFRKFELRTTRA
jgi:hypothetical protein